MQKLNLQMFADNSISFSEDIADFDFDSNPNVQTDDDRVYALYSGDTREQSIEYRNDFIGMYYLESNNYFLSFSNGEDLWIYIFSVDVFEVNGERIDVSRGWYKVNLTDPPNITLEEEVPSFYYGDSLETENILCSYDYFIEMLPDTASLLPQTKTPQQQFEENLTALANSIVEKTGTTDSTIVGLKEAVDNMSTGGGGGLEDPVEYYKSTRPTEWENMHLPSEMATLYPNTDRVEVLLSTPNGGANMLAFTIYGNGTIDWGDGTTETFNYTENTAVYHYYYSTYTKERALVVISGTFNYIDFNPEYIYVNEDGYSSYFSEDTGSGILEIEANIRGIFWLYADVNNIYTTHSNLTYAGINCQNENENNTFLFGNCYCLKCCPELSFGEITSTAYMFSNCYVLQAIPLFDTSKVTDMDSMFNDCRSLTTIPLFDTSKVTDMSSMFYSCYALQTIPLLDTSNVTDMSYMFYSCFSLQTIPLLDTSKVTSMSNMFQYCYSITSIPELNLISCTSTSSLTNTFDTCLKLKSVKVKNMKVAFDLSSSTMYSRADLLVVLNNLAKVTSKKTLTLGSDNLGKLTTQDKAIATNKGWTLA